MLNNPLALTDPMGLGQPPEPRWHGTGLWDPFFGRWITTCLVDGGPGDCSQFRHLDEFDIYAAQVAQQQNVTQQRIGLNGQIYGWVVTTDWNGEYATARGDWYPIGTGSSIDFSVDWTGYYQQAKVFVSALGRNFVAEFENGGCVNLWSHALANDAKGGPSPVGPQREDLVRAAGTGAASAYAASKALSVPLRSSIYRGILGLGERASGVLALGTIDVSLGQALREEVGALRSGECQ